MVGPFLFPLLQAEGGEGDLGDTPTMTAQAGPGAGNGYTGGKQSPVSCLSSLCLRGMTARGSGDTAAMALRAACSGLEITDSKPKPKKEPLSGIWDKVMKDTTIVHIVYIERQHRPLLEDHQALIYLQLILFVFRGDFR